jgi:hypothetical protein
VPGRHVPPFFLEAPFEDAPGGRFVHRIRAVQVTLVGGNEMGLQHAIHRGQALRRLRVPFTPLQQLHEANHGRVGRFGLLGGRAQLGQAPAPLVGVLRAIPDVAAEK